jgi:serine/threonine protein kinase
MEQSTYTTIPAATNNATNGTGTINGHKPTKSPSPSPAPLITLKPCQLPADVQHINDVEWASEDPQNPSPSEYAPRPRFSKIEDPCGCTPAYDEETDTIDTRPCCVDTTCVLFACQEECRANCEAGDLCGNKRITKKLWKDLQVVDAGLKGRGLVLNDAIKASDFIIEYTGVAIQKSYLDAMFRRYRMERMLYIMALDSDVYIDARKKGSIARYINHSCEPNCAVHRWKVKGVIRAGIFALKDIKAGEELSFDYKWKRKRGRAPTKCYCGSASCRGTLEDMLDKTEEEEREEMQLQGHWKVPAKVKGVGSEIMNRTIKVFSHDESEYFMADVCKYDHNVGKHCLIYRGEIEETWENLDDREWMILDEEMEQFVISRKAKYCQPESDDFVSTGEALGVNPTNRPPSPMKTKNYLILQTPMKEKLFSKHLVDRCQRHYRVQISVKQVYEYSNNFQDSEEAADVAKALQESNDGTAWKFDVTGMQPAEALAYIDKNIQDFIESERKATLGEQTDEAQKERQRMNRHEIVIPRCVVDHVKNRMPLLRNNCKNAEITFTASKSMSKQFAKLIIESQDPKAAFDAQVLLWKEVLTLCNNHDAPRTPKGLFKDLAFFGGELSKDDFDLLCPKLSKVDISQDCAENLRESAGMASFEDFYRCTIWVQATEDMGRIDGDNRLVSDAHSGTRKIFFGSEPRRIPELWGHVQGRITETKAGVKFLSMDDEKDYLPFISRSTFEQRPRGFGMLSCFFDYLSKVTCASVQMDNFSQNSIRIDGINSSAPRPIHLDGVVDEGVLNRTKMAEEIIKLQLELLRDNRIRRHRWSFGRDWSLLVTTDSKTEAKIIQERENNQSLNGTGTPRPNSSRPSHKRYIANACIEIAEITEALNLDGSIAGHACVILYRYLNQTSEQIMNVSQSKQRDILLACLFLANKSQKECKWKRLEVVLGCAYKIFYNGAKFDPEGEEGAAWEKRVLATEVDIVKALDYDIFWGGIDWIISQACESGHMKEPVVKNVMELTLTGPVLATGAVIWLKLGPEYAFTAMAALLSFSVKDLITSLSLNPLKLSDAVELVTNSILTNKVTRRKGSKSSHDVFDGRRETFMEVKKHVKNLCKEQVINTPMTGSQSIPSGQVKQNLIISRRYGKRRIIKGVNSAVLNKLLPHFGKVRDCCLCDIYAEEGSGLGATNEDIILEGSWRSLALAEDMLGELAFKSNFYLPSADDADPTSNHTVKIQARSRPGLLSVSSLESAEDWNNVSECGWTKKIGGKTCLPGIVHTNGLEEAGLRWWLRPKYCPNLKGSLCNMQSIRNSFREINTDAHHLELAKVAKALDSISNKPQFPTLTKDIDSQNDDKEEKSFTAVSLQRWPPEKTETREQAKGGMGVGVSPAALQEMQILTKLHGVIPGPQGHPNFILPIAIAMDDGVKNEKEIESRPKSKSIDLVAGSTDNLYSFLQTLDKSESKKEKNRRITGSYLVFQPTPVILQRVMSKNKSKKAEVGQEPKKDIVSSTILTAWFHDLLAAMAHCHTNHIVLRTLHPDQIFIDNNGVAKLSGLTRSIVLHPTDRDRYLDPLSSSKNKKKSTCVTDDDMASNPYMAPELLLGATRYTAQTDVWTLAALMAHLMIGKPIFSGRDRKSKTRAIFKIVGTPSSSNYKEAQSYPYYDKCKPDKKYKSGVDKALRYMFRDGNRSNVDDFSGILSLLEIMLNLDPRKRMSAAEALEHSSMTDFVSNTTTTEHRKKFAADWKVLKENLCAEEDAKTGNGSSNENDTGYIGSSSLSSSLGLSSMSYKRPASYLDSKLGQDDDDGLYDLGDVFGSGRKDDKRARYGK